MLDTLDATAKESHIFGILTFEEIERDLEQDAMRGDLFIVKPTDLISVESRVQFVIDRRQKRLTERNHTKDAPMVDVAGDPATGL
jgi:hypothetical protein